MAGIDLEQDLGQGGIPGQGDGGDFLTVNAGAVYDFVDDLIDGARNHFMQLIQSARLFRIHDPGDNVLAVADLTVEVTIFSENIPGDEIDQLAINGGGADIDGDGVVAVAGIARLDIDDLVLAALHHGPGERGCNLEAGFSQDIRKFSNHRQRNHQPMFMVTLFEETDETAGVGQIIAGGRRGKLEVAFFHRRYKKASILEIIQIYLLNPSCMPGGKGLVQDSGVNLRLDRNAHHQIARDSRKAGQAIAVLQIHLTQCFRGAPFNRTAFYDYPALPALSFASAGSIHMNPGFHGAVQEAFAIGKHGFPVVG